MRVIRTCSILLIGILAACSVASRVPPSATSFVIAPANVCVFGTRQRPFFAWRGWGYCPTTEVRT